MPTTFLPSLRIRLDSYFTDEQRLVRVVGFAGEAVIVEDALTEREFIVKPDDFEKWRPVKLADG